MKLWLRQQGCGKQACVMSLKSHGGQCFKVKWKKTASMSFSPETGEQTWSSWRIFVWSSWRRITCRLRFEASIIFGRRLIALLNHRRWLDLAHRFRWKWLLKAAWRRTVFHTSKWSQSFAVNLHTSINSLMKCADIGTKVPIEFSLWRTSGCLNFLLQMYFPHTNH